MTQHTPGPWKVQPDGKGIMFSGSAGANIVPWGNETPLPHADMRLIAAAPEMYRKLLNIASIVKQWDNGTMSDVEAIQYVRFESSDALLARVEGKS